MDKWKNFFFTFCWKKASKKRENLVKHHSLHLTKCLMLVDCYDIHILFVILYFIVELQFEFQSYFALDLFLATMDLFSLRTFKVTYITRLNVLSRVVKSSVYKFIFLPKLANTATTTTSSRFSLLSSNVLSEGLWDL